MCVQKSIYVQAPGYARAPAAPTPWAQTGLATEQRSPTKRGAACDGGATLQT